MQSTRPETSPVKAGRRVLGEKNTNASLTPSAAAKRQHKPITTDAIPFNPLKKTAATTTTRTDRDVSHAGQKRTIDQVCGSTSETEDVEPRKAIVVTSARSESTDQDFQMFDDNNNNTRPISPSREVSLTGVAATQASEQLIPSQTNKLERESEETPTSISTSSVPTEPAARRIFIQEKAALVRQRLQSAMHRVENSNSLDRALSQFEASSRPFVPRGSMSRASSSPALIAAAAAAVTKTTTSSSSSQAPSPKQRKRVLLPPLPIQPNSRPVRASARTSIPSLPCSESPSITAIPQEEEEEEEEEEKTEEERDEEDEETPKAQAENQQQRPSTEIEKMKAALDEANALHKLKELAQSSTNAEQTAGR